MKSLVQYLRHSKHSEYISYYYHVVLTPSKPHVQASTSCIWKKQIHFYKSIYQ